jgi:hypothetical protein
MRLLEGLLVDRPAQRRFDAGQEAVGCGAAARRIAPSPNDQASPDEAAKVTK